MCNALGKEGVVTVLDFNEAVGPLVPHANKEMVGHRPPPFKHPSNAGAVSQFCPPTASTRMPSNMVLSSPSPTELPSIFVFFYVHNRDHPSEHCER